MTSIQFNQIVENRLDKIRNTLVEKAKEYANDKDRLHNFNRGAAITGKTREDVLWGFALKHFVSFMDILDGIRGGKFPDKDKWDEKIGDLINYLILIDVCVIEDIEKDESLRVKTTCAKSSREFEKEYIKLGKQAIKAQHIANKKGCANLQDSKNK